MTFVGWVVCRTFVFSGVCVLIIRVSGAAASSECLAGQQGAVLMRFPLPYHPLIATVCLASCNSGSMCDTSFGRDESVRQSPLVAFGPDDLSQAVANLRWRYLAGQCRQDYSTKSWCVITLVQHIPYPQGIQGLYPGLTASIFRQMTYSVTRFGAYDAMKNVMSNNGESQVYS